MEPTQDSKKMLNISKLLRNLQEQVNQPHGRNSSKVIDYSDKLLFWVIGDTHFHPLLEVFPAGFILISSLPSDDINSCDAAERADPWSHVQYCRQLAYQRNYSDQTVVCGSGILSPELEPLLQIPSSPSMYSKTATNFPTSPAHAAHKLNCVCKTGNKYEYVVLERRLLPVAQDTVAAVTVSLSMLLSQDKKDNNSALFPLPIIFYVGDKALESEQSSFDTCTTEGLETSNTSKNSRANDSVFSFISHIAVKRHETMHSMLSMCTLKKLKYPQIGIHPSLMNTKITTILEKFNEQSLSSMISAYWNTRDSFLGQTSAGPSLKVDSLYNLSDCLLSRHITIEDHFLASEMHEDKRSKSSFRSFHLTPGPYLYLAVSCKISLVKDSTKVLDLIERGLASASSESATIAKPSDSAFTGMMSDFLGKLRFLEHLFHLFQSLHHINEQGGILSESSSSACKEGIHFFSSANTRNSAAFLANDDSLEKAKTTSFMYYDSGVEPYQHRSEALVLFPSIRSSSDAGDHSQGLYAAKLGINYPKKPSQVAPTTSLGVAKMTSMDSPTTGSQLSIHGEESFSGSAYLESAQEDALQKVLTAFDSFLLLESQGQQGSAGSASVASDLPCGGELVSGRESLVFNAVLSQEIACARSSVDDFTDRFFSFIFYMKVRDIHCVQKILFKLFKVIVFDDTMNTVTHKHFSRFFASNGGNGAAGGGNVFPSYNDGSFLAMLREMFNEVFEERAEEKPSPLLRCESSVGGGMQSSNRIDASDDNVSTAASAAPNHGGSVVNVAVKGPFVPNIRKTNEAKLAVTIRLALGIIKQLRYGSKLAMCHLLPQQQNSGLNLSNSAGIGGSSVYQKSGSPSTARFHELYAAGAGGSGGLFSTAHPNAYNPGYTSFTRKEAFAGVTTANFYSSNPNSGVHKVGEDSVGGVHSSVVTPHQVTSKVQASQWTSSTFFTPQQMMGKSRKGFHQYMPAIPLTMIEGSGASGGSSSSSNASRYLWSLSSEYLEAVKAYTTNPYETLALLIELGLESLRNAAVQILSQADPSLFNSQIDPLEFLDKLNSSEISGDYASSTNHPAGTYSSAEDIIGRFYQHLEGLRKASKICQVIQLAKKSALPADSVRSLSSGCLSYYQSFDDSGVTCPVFVSAVSSFAVPKLLAGKQPFKLRFNGDGRDDRWCVLLKIIEAGKEDMSEAWFIKWDSGWEKVNDKTRL